MLPGYLSIIREGVDTNAAARDREQPTAHSRHWRGPSPWLPPLVLLAAALLFRLPPLLNARGLHSDAAVVGLQARHLLRGEWAWFLWGTNYQSAVDSILAAGAFAFAGATPLVLMIVQLLGHLALLWLAYDVLRKRLSSWVAAIATLPLVFTPYVINSVALYPPRQSCMTCLFAAIWLLDGASASRWPLLRYGAGAASGMFALYLDLFALQFTVGLGVFALACCLDQGARRRLALQRAGASALGFALGLALVFLIRRVAGVAATTTSLSPARIGSNFWLLWNEALPWVLSYKVYRFSVLPTQAPDLWQPPLIFQIVQIAGAVLLLLGIACGGLAIVSRRVPWPVRRLGLFGFTIAGCSLGGFLVSTMVIDTWSARYLAPIVWTAPFALAPVVYLLRGRLFALALAPYIVAVAVASWLNFGPYVSGPLPILDPRGQAHEEAQLGEVLRQRGIQYGAAHYWLSYRLTFLWSEETIVVPLDPAADRYPPYRRAYDDAPRVAWIFHPSEPRAQPETYEAQLRTTGARYERLEVAGFTVLVWQR